MTTDVVPGKTCCSLCGALVADITQHMLWHKSGGRYKVNQRWPDSLRKRRGSKDKRSVKR